MRRMLDAKSDRDLVALSPHTFRVSMQYCVDQWQGEAELTSPVGDTQTVTTERVPNLLW